MSLLETFRVYFLDIGITWVLRILSNYFLVLFFFTRFLNSWVKWFLCLTVCSYIFPHIVQSVVLLGLISVLVSIDIRVILPI